VAADKEKVVMLSAAASQQHKLWLQIRKREEGETPKKGNSTKQTLDMV